jgi:hypothetical protein
VAGFIERRRQSDLRSVLPAAGELRKPPTFTARSCRRYHGARPAGIAGAAFERSTNAMRITSAFLFEANSLIKRNCTLVVGVNGQLEADKSETTRFAQRSVNERSSMTSAAERRKEAHSQYPGVGVNWPTLRDDIAPSDNVATSNGDKLRIALRDIVHYELACVVQRRRFKEGKVPPLTRNEVHRTMEAFHVLGAEMA